jgi:hypothetical protein
MSINTSVQDIHILLRPKPPTVCRTAPLIVLAETAEAPHPICTRMDVGMNTQRNDDSSPRKIELQSTEEIGLDEKLSKSYDTVVSWSLTSQDARTDRY